MAQINKPSDYFNTVLYTGNGGTNNITGVNFQPDWTWIKCRNNARNHTTYDVVRGATNQIYPNLTNAEATDATSLTSFDSDGFSLGSVTALNASGETFASWNWLADNTSGSSNTQGSITSTVSANTTSGFSIVSFNFQATGNQTIGHGLGSVPKMIIMKGRDSSADAWWVYHESIGATNYLRLNTIDASQANSGVWSTTPTSQVFTVGSLMTTSNYGTRQIAYCFAEKKGFSKFGSYTGNGSSDGTFVFTGMKPAWIMVRATSGNRWRIADNKRPGYNTAINALFAELSAAESTSSGDEIDLLSNGFKLRGTSANQNASGTNYIYMAFAENPLVGTNNIPATAR